MSEPEQRPAWGAGEEMNAFESVMWRMERFYGYGPLAGGATLITFVTHGPVTCVGVGYDTASVTEPKIFLDSLVDGFAEVLALHPGTGEPRLRV